MFPTIYSLRVEEVNSGYYETLDTIYTYSCIGAYQKYVYENCARYLYVYADSSIKEKPIITQPKCLNPGSIIFPNTPSRSLYNLYDGEYEFTLSNDVCSETYNITLEDDFICNYYFPNAFQPSSLDNRLFQLFFDKPLQYTLFIYDRWGNLLYQENLTSDSNQGWDGTFQNKLCSPGVYIWRAVVHSDQVYYPSGDVTLIE
jgi:gliding motility-associated-like protein